MEDDKRVKKSKKSSKRLLHDEDDKVVKERKKKPKRESSSSESDLDKNSFNDSKRRLPNWLEMSDSEDQFQKPKEKVKDKKRKIQAEAPEAQAETPKDVSVKKNGSQDHEKEPQVESKDSPKKKKKKRQEVEHSPCETFRKNRPCPKKFKKERTEESPVNSQENGDVTDAEAPLEIEETVSKETLRDVQQSPGKTSPKKSSKSHKNLFTEHEEVVSDPERHADPPQDVFEEETKEPVKQPSPKKSPTKSVEPKLIPEAALQTKQTAKQKSQESVEPPKETKRPVKRITKVPLAEQLTLGEEYKMKKMDEKSCKNCNEPVKIKTKTKVRDVGTQTNDSALMNGIKTRGRPRAPPKVKAEDPVSVKDRIITPRQPTDEDEVHDVKNKPKPLSQEQISRLRSLIVNLKHPVPPQHDVEMTAGCRALTSEEKQNFQTFEKLRTGVWQVEEDKIILKNWRNFCKRHDWNPELTLPFTAWRHKGAYYIPKMEERKKFLQFLAHGLPSRSLYHVYARFKNLFSTHKTDRYTPLEDKILMDKIENNPDLDKNMYLAELAATLNRTRQSIWRRYRILKKKAEETEDD
ncbi:uncharacterized protein LOC107048546 [Diachasma alloeum]|uniref:uncharacterized protein LOC107048546 n=1 Tax=Diachasma alloeum TaxID=454923 RepID=UPI0007382884|nr:uncharacterized protein LOC107048546 [Diachasma alloeum]